MKINCTSDGACDSVVTGGMGLHERLAGAGNTESTPSPLVPDFSLRPYEIYRGDALETVRRLTAGGIQFDTVFTSPPFFKLRNYGNDAREIGRERGEAGVGSFVSTLVSIFKNIPLRPWASVWVNLGDKRGPNKELQGVPERFVIAMQDARFFLVDRVVWAKEVVKVDGTAFGHCMVEPAPGRLNGNGWEHLFRFTLDPSKAWSDACAIQIPRDFERFYHEGTETRVEQHPYSTAMNCVTSQEGRIPPNVWYVNTSRNGKTHYAAMPRELVERPVAMTCPEWLVDDGGGITPRTRIVEQTVYSEGARTFITVYGQFSHWQELHPHESTGNDTESAKLEALRGRSGRNDSARRYVPRYPRTVGWTHMDKPVVGSGIVLDPFGGTGTTGEVAVLLGRRFVGIDLYQEYADRMAMRCAEAFENRAASKESNTSYTVDSLT